MLVGGQEDQWFRVMWGWTSSLLTWWTGGPLVPGNVKCGQTNEMGEPPSVPEGRVTNMIYEIDNWFNPFAL